MKITRDGRVLRVTEVFIDSTRQGQITLGHSVYPSRLWIKFYDGHSVTYFRPEPNEAKELGLALINYALDFEQ